MENVEKEKAISKNIETTKNEINSHQIKEKNPEENKILNNKNNILRKIFKFDESNQKYLPKINLDCSKEILAILSHGQIPKYKNKEELFNFIKDKIDIINQIKKIIGRSYELLQIIISYLEKNNIFIFQYFIDLYFEILLVLLPENNSQKTLIENKFVSNELLNEIKNIINYLICCGFMKKTIIDYIYQKLAESQFHNTLSNYIFYNYLDLIEIFYGKNYNKEYKNKLIAKDYLYFYNKEKSGIKINISSNKNNININKGCSIIIWFNLNEFNYNDTDKIESILCEIKINENYNYKFILNEKNDIIVKSNDTILTENNKEIFKLDKHKWIQLKIQINRKQIKLNLFQEETNIKSLDKKNSFGYSGENIEIIKYKTKIYSIDELLKIDNLNVKYLNFFRNYEGLVGTIVFCNNDNPSEAPIKSRYGIKSNKISNFIGDSGLRGIYFIFSPSLFINEKSLFIDLSNNIIGEINNDKFNVDAIEFNNVYKYKNYINNIYNLGGSANLLPLFEIFWKFTNDVKNKDNKEEQIKLNILFKKLIKILELIFVNKKKNYLEALYNNQIDKNTFFESLQLFLQLIDEKYYQFDNEILNSLLNIGKSIFKYCRGKEKNNKEIYYYFKYILFDPIIVIKFNLSQQDILWNFFETIKTSDNIFSNSDYKKCFMSFEKMNKFFLLLDQKYKNRPSLKKESIISPSLMNIIRNIFEDPSTKDTERENLFFCNAKNLNITIMEGIIEIFIFYYDINKNIFVEKYSQNSLEKINIFKEDDIKESVLELRNNSLKYLLNSENNFIEILLNLFSTTNISLKKVIIIFIKIITRKYENILNNYFNGIDIQAKKSKGNFFKINKKEFYFFIEENISTNYFNYLIMDEKKEKINNNQNKKETPKKLLRQKTMKEIPKIKISDEKEESQKDNKNNEIKKNIDNDNQADNNNLDISNEQNKNICIIDNKSEINKVDKKRSIRLDVKLNILTENKIKRCLSSKIKKIDNIKSNFLNNIRSKLNNGNNIKIVSKERIKELANYCANYFMGKEIEKKIDINEYNEKKEIKNISSENKNIEKDKNILNQNNINNENPITNENLNKENELSLNEIQKINCEISMILFDWLLAFNVKNKNLTKGPDNSNYKILTDKNNKINGRSNIFEVETILNILVKFLSNIKEIEVIHKLLFVIKSQKYTGIIDEIGKNNEIYSNSNYYKLLNYFSFSNTKFLQLLEELLINSYLCKYDKDSKNKFIFIPENTKIRTGLNNKEDYFNIIYKNSKELLLDIYFHEENKNKNKIIYDIINIMILLKHELDVYKDKNKFNILLKLLESLLLEICEIYNNKLNFNNFKSKFSEEDIQNNNKVKNKVKIYDKNIINNSYDKYYNSIIRNYISLAPFIFEYCFLINKCDDFISQNIKITKMKNFSEFPEYINKENNLEVYFKFYQEIVNIFDIRKLSEKNTKNNLENEKEIYYFSENETLKLINEYVYNKDNRNKLRSKLEILLKKNNDFNFKNQLSLIEIISIFNNYCLEKYLNNNESNKTNFIPKGNIISFLNSHQFFIIYIILTSCNIRDNDNYTLLNITYKEIQEIFYISLQFNINYIIKNLNSPNFIIIFNNILSLISKIWTINNEKEGKFVFIKNFDFNKTSIKLLLDYYIVKNTSFFNSTNFINFSKNTMKMTEKTIIENIDKIQENIINRTNEEMNEKPIIEILDLKKFENIYFKRKLEFNKIKLILIHENINNIHPIIYLDEKDLIEYKIIYTKIKDLKIKYNFNLIKESYKDIKRRKNYRKIKKKLYSWNNSYSNLNAFYNIANNNKSNEKKAIYKLKYKISNFLSKDLTRKLIVPIMDFDYYMPNFSNFNYKNKLFEKKEDKNIDEFIYKIDLKIFNPLKDNILPEFNDENYFINEVCYIQTTHHIRGRIFISKKNSLNDIYFSTNKKCLLTPEKLKKYDDYDSSHLSCFGSIFKNNLDQKDPEIYIKINYSEINFIFIRKYCFRSNSLEIYTNNHRSYYFKFMNDKKRNYFLENIINKFNKTVLKKQLFKPIKGIDENNKTIIIGYFKDEDNNKEFSFISNIKDLWKLNKISTLEYLMWINIYGNRSFRDIAQYPVFPWLLCNYESDYFEDLLLSEENIRDLRLPLGMQCIDEKSRKRKEDYIETYKIMVMDLYNENLIKFKMKEEDYMDEPNSNIENINKRDSGKFEHILSEDLNLIKKNFSSSLLNHLDINSDNKNKNEYKIIINPIYDIPIFEKLYDDKLPKVFDNNFNLNKLYTNLNIEYEKIPYCFGSHFSNGAYVAHYLGRLFPYASVMIEIQGSGFDCPERLFLDLQKSFYSVITEKSDLREIIPELFTLPELFLNINNFNFGKVELEEKKEEENLGKQIKNNENIIINLNEGKNFRQVEEVLLPNWCKNNPYYFIEKNRFLIENHNLNINPWIDLIFGYLQRGPQAQSIGNIYLANVYDGVMNFRVKPEDVIKDRSENEFKMRLFEMGVHPTKVFDKKCKINKNKINNQLISSNHLVEGSENILYEINLKNNKNKIIYFNTKDSSPEELHFIDKNFIERKILIQKNKESNIYLSKEISVDKLLTEENYILKNIEYNLIFKQLYKGIFYIITGLFDGKIYLIRNKNKIISKKEEKEYKIDNSIIKNFDRSLITVLEIDKEEKYIIYGTQKGSLIIYSLNYSLFKEGKNFINLIKFFSSHSGFSINSICINNDLNLFADCAYDGYAHIYSLPKCKLIQSIYIESNYKNNYFSLDYIFLSAQPLASIILYSNKAYTFKCFSINGNELINSNNDYDAKLIKENKNNIDIDELGMKSPIIFTDSQYNDYLLYILDKKYIFIKKFPSMENIVFISPSLIKEEKLNNIAISYDLKYLYIYEEINNKIYIIHKKNNNTIHINRESKDNKAHK